MASKVKVIQMATRRCRPHSTVRSHVFCKLFMESVLLKANLVNLSTGQYWLNFDGQKGMSDREGHGHKAVLYKSHFPATKAFTKTFLLERHHCIHRLINHVYTKGQALCYSLPHDRYHAGIIKVDLIHHP